MAEKPAFKTAFRKRRCIIPADGFYEWQRGRRARSRSSRCSCTGATASRSRSPGCGRSGRTTRRRTRRGCCTCAIVTTDANDTLAPIHDRMPVMLAEDAWDTWLDVAHRTIRARCEPLLVPAPDDLSSCGR